MHGLSAPAETGRWDDRKGEEAKTQENIEAETMQATLIEDEALLAKPTNLNVNKQNLQLSIRILGKFFG